jgi:hypothetical protein
LVQQAITGLLISTTLLGLDTLTLLGTEQSLAITLELEDTEILGKLVAHKVMACQSDVSKTKLKQIMIDKAGRKLCLIII